ncbi:MAG: chorismate synthase [Planctomycetaceae bacterium]|nr:chorismate synthase [Planctomycetaceae bacterium]
MALRYITAGESHGPGMLAVVEGLPAGLTVDQAFIDGELRRRQAGYGRGGRQRMETDAAEVLTGVMQGHTMGGPVTLRIANRDSRLDDAAKTPPVHQPRPGHADLAGSVKWLTTDCRATLERASARETAARVAAGALARCLLRDFGIECFGFVRASLDVRCACDITPANWRDMRAARDASDVGMPCTSATQQLIDRIHQAKVDKDTVGGLVEVHVFGCPIGLGTCVQWNERLDSRLAAATMGIQAFKAVEIGLGRECAFRTGSQVHDPTGTMKPISTLLRGMPSVDLNTKAAVTSAYERSDISAIAAASVVLENVVAFEIARAFLEKFGGDSMTQLRASHGAFMQLARQLPLQG